MKTNQLFKSFMLAASLGSIVSFGSIASTTQQSESILSAYLQIKDALVKTDGQAASAAAKDLLALVTNQKDDLSKKLAVDAKQISESTDVAAQRKIFNGLSDNMYAYVKSSTNHEAPIFRQYCPMVNAYWLAAEKEINNPYYGSKMLHCGVVKEEL